METNASLETEISSLQYEIDRLKKNISLAESEEKVTSAKSKYELKRNTLEMKQLQMEIEDLQVGLKSQKRSDYKLMQEAIHEKCGGKLEELLNGNSTKELFQQIEHRVLNLSAKRDALSNNLQILKHTLAESENALKKITVSCQGDGIPTEDECIQRIRDLENEQSKMLRNIDDCESARDKLKAMLEHAREKLYAHYQLSLDLEKERLMMANDGVEAKNKEFNETESINLEEKRKELEKLKKAILLIKDTTCSYDIKDIESDFLLQKSTNKDLNEMVKKSEKRLIELKDEKQNLAYKKFLTKKTDSRFHASDKIIDLSKNQLAEQKRKRDLAKEELQRLNSMSNEMRDVFQRLIVKMQPKINKKELKKKDIKHLSKQCENLIKYTFPSVQNSSAKNYD